MRARGRTLGLIMVVSSQPGRRYDGRDLAFVEDLAHRAAVAIDNAQLYQQAQAATEQARVAAAARDEFLSVTSPVWKRGAWRWSARRRT